MVVIIEDDDDGGGSGNGNGGPIDLSGYTTDAELAAHAGDDNAHHVQPDLPEHDAAIDSHDNGIYGRIRLHDRGAIRRRGCDPT